MTQQVKAKEIVTKVCNYYGIEEKYIYKKLRKKQVINSRHMAIYLVKKHVNMNNTDMAEVFKKDRTTILHAVQKMQDLLTLPHEEDLKKDVENLNFLIQIH